MKFVDRLKNSLKTKEKTSASVASDMQNPRQDSAEDLWLSLCENPNLEDKIPLLLSICKTKGGPAAVYAALEELSHIPGSWLPQVYLGQLALEQNDFDQASQWYKGVLSSPEPKDYALFMISADLGRCGGASLMPLLLAPVYDVQQNDIHIGLNLLKAYQDLHDHVSGQQLLLKIRRCDEPGIHDYLEGFADAFAAQKKEEKKAGAAAAGAAAGKRQMLGKDDLLLASASLPETVEVDVPIWGRDLDGIDALLPGLLERKRVGVYMYSDTSSQDSQIPLHEAAVHPSDLAVSLPLFIGERILFSTQYAPIALYPVSREKGPQSGSLEPDVQSLLALCTKESLDYIITGTIYRDGTVCRVRSWILDKAKQNARIVAKDLPYEDFGAPFISMIDDIMVVFRDKRNARTAGRADFLHVAPSEELMSMQLQALSYLLYQNLVHRGICDASILPDDKKMLDTYACLAGTETKNQVYLLMLLYGMKNVRRLGSDMYLNYRELLYENADKTRSGPFVKAAMNELNAILQEKE